MPTVSRQYGGVTLEATAWPVFEDLDLRQADDGACAGTYCYQNVLFGAVTKQIAFALTYPLWIPDSHLETRVFRRRVFDCVTRNSIGR